jgi:DNA gyrase subunit A
MYTKGEKVIPIYIEDEMKDAYISYAMSVIVGRALPDVRDGLKPVHRRLLYAMKELNLEHNKPYKKAARIVGECFVEDTLVLTSRGLLPILEVKQGDMVYTQRGLRRVSALYEMPPQRLLKISLENGTYNIVTPSQKFKVVDKDFGFSWKEAKDLTNNDYIVVRAFYPDIKRKVKLKKFAEFNPVYLTEEVAYLIGFFMAKGWLAKSKSQSAADRIDFYCNSEEAIGKIADILMKEFDYVPDILEGAYLPPGRNRSYASCRYTIRVSRKYIIDFLKENFNLHTLNTSTKTVPQQIFSSPKSVIFAFVSGLIDGDGSIDKDRGLIYYGSISEELIDRLLLLLQHCGILGVKYFYKNTRASSVKGHSISARHKFYYLEFKGINAEVLACKLRLFNPKKQAALYKVQSRLWRKSRFKTVPYTGENIFAHLRKARFNSEWHRDWYADRLRQVVRYSTGCKISYAQQLKEETLRKSQILDWGSGDKLKKIDSPLYSFLNHIIEDDIYFLKVSSVEEAGCKRTYDLGVEDEHEFIANGMISHNCLGKFHPHGDMAVFDALVRMVQDFSLRYPLVDGQGNFGSIDGDSPAAMRYVEARLSPITDWMLKDIEKQTVNFVPNFDESLTEPVILPATLPNLLINGSSGIAVGMATNIPPHNLGEIIEGIKLVIDKPDCAVKDLMRLIKGPDFPTGGLICGREGIKQAFLTGRGRLKVRAKASIEQQKNSGKEAIIISEIPYQVNKSNILEAIARLVQDKKVEGISALRDESDKDGMRIVVELRRGTTAQVVLNQLYKHTQMEETFGVIMLALVNNQPRVLNLKQMLEFYIEHRKEIIIRRTTFELHKAEERAHILEGLKVALSSLDKVIKTIRQSKNPQIAKEALMKNFSLSERQAQAILEMQLQRLTALERDKIDQEYLELIKKIEQYRAILASEKKILVIVKEELDQIKKKFADERRTQIVGEIEELEIEDLIVEEDVIITISHSGYIKRLPISAYRRQRRGGRGITAMETREEDFVEHLFIASTHEYILFFTNKGKVYWLKVHEIPQAGRLSKGKAIVNLLQLDSGETISARVPVKEFDSKKFLVLTTKQGLIKKTCLDAFSNPRKAGIVAISLEEADELIAATLTDGKQEIFLASRQGMAVRFKEEDVRDMGRTAKGVRAIKLGKKDEVIGMEIVRPDATLLTVTEAGFGKRTAFKEYRRQSRGGKGVINIKVTKKNGEVIGLKSVTDRDEVMIITQNGMVVRCPVKDIRSIGRNTQGVRVIRLDAKDRVSSLASVVKKEEE